MAALVPSGLDGGDVEDLEIPEGADQGGVLPGYELRYYEELPVRDIAAALKCSEGNVKSILFRSLQKMRRTFAVQQGENPV